MYTLPDCIIFQHEGFAKRISALIAVVVITLLIYESSDNFTNISGSSSSLSVNPGHVFTRHRKKTCTTGTRRAYPRVLIIGNNIASAMCMCVTRMNTHAALLIDD